MKKNLLLMMLCMPVVLVAQNDNGVMVSGLAVDAGTVTFNVSWDKNNPSDTVWVFVDYNDAGVMRRLPVTDATASAGTVTKIPNNDKGVWVEGNAWTNDSFSATVELFTEIKDVAGACAYASNYPPVGEYTSASEISFTGTPMYEIWLSGGAIVYAGKEPPYTISPDSVIASFTDATGAPGVLVPATYTLSGSDGCAEAGITLTLLGSQKGWKYQLYKGDTAVGDVMDGTGNALPFSDVSAAGNFNYTVWAVDNPTITAQRAMQVSNVHEITVKPMPTILRTGGDASQTVNMNTAITAMTYTASNDATIAMTGSFPEGVNGNASGSSYTISGMPTVTGTFGYSLTAAVGGCTSTAAVGTLTNAGTPPYAASPQIWVIGLQTWSAPLLKPQAGCTETDDFGTTNPPTIAYYRSSGLCCGSGYLYNWKCVMDYDTQLCPSPWRVPSGTDMVDLDKALGGNGAFRNDAPLDWITANYIEAWGGNWAGYGDGANILAQYEGTMFYTTTPTLQNQAVYVRYNVNGEVRPNGFNPSRFGIQVRCVK
jgi:uncharacterized protein (TIGR02145 family)